MKIELSDLDSNRFGFPCARSSGWSKEGHIKAMEFCVQNSIKLLISRAEVIDTDASWQLQCEGAKHVDTLLYCNKILTDDEPLVKPSYLKKGLHIRKSIIGDNQQLFELGVSAFSSYFGHYHNDKLIDSATSDLIYADWCSKFASQESDSPCYVLESSDGVVGLAGLKILGSGEEWDGELFAVHPDARGQKGFSALLDTSLFNAKESGASSFSYSTQIQNTSVLNALYRRGFYLEKVVNTFHLWFAN